MKILALDLALLHSGMIILKNGNLSSYKVLIPPKKINTSKFKEHNKLYDLRRLNYLTNKFDEFLKEQQKDEKIDYVILEDYAYSSTSSSTYQIGAFGESVKLKLYNLNIPIRTVDPLSVKLFATGSAKADKDDIINVVKNKWEGIDFQKLIYPNKTKFTKNEEKYIEDLADSYVMGKILYTELLLRKGEILLKDLDEHEIRLFNRTTTKNPINILASDFILKDHSIDTI